MVIVERLLSHDRQATRLCVSCMVARRARAALRGAHHDVLPAPISHRPALNLRQIGARRKLIGGGRLAQQVVQDHKARLRRCDCGTAQRSRGRPSRIESAPLSAIRHRLHDVGAWRRQRGPCASSGWSNARRSAAERPDEVGRGCACVSVNQSSPAASAGVASSASFAASSGRHRGSLHRLRPPAPPASRSRRRPAALSACGSATAGPPAMRSVVCARDGSAAPRRRASPGVQPAVPAAPANPQPS